MDKLHSLYTVIDLGGTFAFAVSGAVAAKQKGLDVFGILVVAFTVACGGGVIRDIFLNRIPVIFEKEIDASAALLGAVVVVAGHYWGLSNDWIFPAGFLVCLVIRLLALKYHWKLPSFRGKK